MKTGNLSSFKSSGSIGRVTLVSIGDTTIVKSKVDKRPKDEALSLSQRLTQARYATCMNAYHVLAPLLKRTLLKTKPMQRANGLFLQCNSHDLEAVLTKKEAERGAGLLCHYVVSRGDGQLPPIEVETVGDNHLFSIELGDFEVGPETTLSDFSCAVTLHNPRLRFGDALTLVVCRQQAEGPNGLPDFTWGRATVVLQIAPSPDRGRTLGSLLGGLRLVSVPCGAGHKLGTPAEEGVLIALIHSRMLKDGRVTSSEQRLHGSNPFLANKTTPEAWAAAAQTYGRVKPDTPLLPFHPTPTPPRSLEDYFG